jgi:two-component system sensor histidine kinase/response regulator
LDILNAGSVAVDLVLMDIQMPVMDGLTATKAIRRNPAWQSLPIVAMTANASTADREASIEAGMNDHVAKPFDLSALVKVIRRLLSQVSPTSVVAKDPLPVDSSSVLSPEIALQSTLHGIDIDSALARFGGRVVAYGRALNTFAIEAATFGEKLRVAWAADDRGELGRLLHALKGMAGTVGAQRLTNATASMEDALHETAAVSPESFGQLRTLLQTQADAIAEIGRLVLQSGLVSTDLPTPAIDVPTLQGQISALHACLQTPNLAALGLVESIREPLVAWRPQLGQKLLNAVAQLDFADAQKICSELLHPSKTAT